MERRRARREERTPSPIRRRDRRRARLQRLFAWALSAGIALRYQHALDQHSVLRLDAFGAAYDDGETGGGFRAEWSYQF